MMVRQDNNIFGLMENIKKGNPEQMVMSLLQSSAQGNPVMQNLLTLAQKGNSKEIEQIARNMAREKGLDFDTEFNSFRRTFGL